MTYSEVHTRGTSESPLLQFLMKEDEGTYAASRERIE